VLACLQAIETNDNYSRLHTLLKQSRHQWLQIPTTIWVVNLQLTLRATARLQKAMSSLDAKI
jgi:hypothetical protein